MTGFSLGSASITPDVAVAGEYGTWTLIYTVGTLGMDEGGRLKVGTANVSDFGTPQFTAPDKPNYVSVHTDGKARVAPVYDRLGYVRPHMKTIELTVQGAALGPGDKIVVTLGDRRSGSPGMTAQSFSDNAFLFKVAVDPFQSGIFREVRPDLSLRISNGKPVRLRVLGPSLVRPGERFSLGIRVDDRWGNPCADFFGRVHLSTTGGKIDLPDEVEFNAATAGAIRLDDLTARDAAQPIIVSARNIALGLQAESNPMLVKASDFRLCWGDLQGQTFETAGTGTMPEYFEYARRAAVLDFVAHTAHDFQFTDSDWARLRDNVKSFHDPGRFVPILAYEWSANTPNGGDHCVFYLSDDGPLYRCSDWMVQNSKETHLAYTADELFRILKRDCPRGQVMVIPHVGGRRANLDFHDADLEPVIEICSCHGWSEWFYEEALAKGYRVGVVGDSDDVSCRIGANFPAKNHFGVRNGLTAVYASELTREAIWSAINSRHCYATTGDRILVDFRMGEYPMGSEAQVDRPPAFVVKVVGTAPLERIELRRGSKVVGIWPKPSSVQLAPNRYKMWWGGHTDRGRQKAARWDGGLTLEGPGSIQSAVGVAFHNPDHGLREVQDRALSWHSTTYGNRHGVTFTLAGGSDQTRLLFATDTLTFDFLPGEIGAQGLWRDAGGVNRFAEVARVPLNPPPTSLEVEFTDHDVIAGTHPYYVRVLQTNGEMAWSSPIFITATDTRQQ